MPGVAGSPRLAAIAGHPRRWLRFSPNRPNPPGSAPHPAHRRQRRLTPPPAAPPCHTLARGLAEPLRQFRQPPHPRPLRRARARSCKPVCHPNPCQQPRLNWPIPARTARRTAGPRVRHPAPSTPPAPRPATQAIPPMSGTPTPPCPTKHQFSPAPPRDLRHRKLPCPSPLRRCPAIRRTRNRHWHRQPSRPDRQASPRLRRHRARPTLRWPLSLSLARCRRPNLPPQSHHQRRPRQFHSPRPTGLRVRHLPQPLSRHRLRLPAPCRPNHRRLRFCRWPQCNQVQHRRTRRHRSRPGLIWLCRRCRANPATPSATRHRLPAGLVPKLRRCGSRLPLLQAQGHSTPPGRTNRHQVPKPCRTRQTLSGKAQRRCPLHPLPL